MQPNEMSADIFRKEIEELKTFIVELKSDRAAQKEKERREVWTKYTSMSLVFMAVFAAIATQWAGKYSSRVLVAMTRSTLMQARASDQWSYFQAASVKRNLYELTKEQAERSAASGTADNVKYLESMGLKINKYREEQDKTKKAAEELERQRESERESADIASQHGSRMGLAVSIFQISIAMGSICLVTKKKPLWYLSLALGAIGLAEMIYVWTH